MVTQTAFGSDRALSRNIVPQRYDERMSPRFDGHRSVRHDKRTGAHSPHPYGHKPNERALHLRWLPLEVYEQIRAAAKYRNQRLSRFWIPWGPR
jgi:hypothetical protein